MMEQNGLQIRNQHTHISLEHYDTYLHRTDAYFLLTSVTDGYGLDLEFQNAMYLNGFENTRQNP